MKILFIRPKPSTETIGLQHVMIVEPLELEILANLLAPNDVPIIIDMILEKKSIEFFISQEKPDILCVTGYITHVPTIICYCRTAKQINSMIYTIVGGVHCEVCSNDFDDESIDFRVVRNATTVFPQLLDFIRGNGEMPKGVLRPGETFVRSDLPIYNFYVPFPNRQLTARYRNKYFYIFHDKVALIKTAFGCPYSCNFCFCRHITGGCYKERPLDEVIQELQSIKEQNIYIVDDDFFANRTRVLNFIKAHQSAGLQKQYLLYGRADFIAKNPNIISAFKEIGLKTVIVGFESFFDHDLEQYNKNIDAITNEKAMSVLNQFNVDCYATIIVSPEWGKSEFDLCRKKFRMLGIHYVNLQPLTPLPGMGYVVDDKNLIIPYNDYAKWDLAHVTIRPTQMSVAAFYKRILKLYNATLFQPSILHGYLQSYSPLMLWRMMRGSFLVHSQYRQRIREAKRHA
ncbi:MAG: radical SAM protein [Calditrichaeota bacterium]|nr:MAG: radical SAM protein [Calditrichota bacterium]